MILFFAKYPEKNKILDGMEARIIDIDNIFESESRFYVTYNHENNANFKRIERRISKNSTFLSLNSNFLKHRIELSKLLKKARLIYVHSVLNADSIRFLYFIPAISNKIATDIHGIVPEEERLKGNSDLADYYEGVEETVVAKSKFLISVTNKMTNHLNEKYPKYRVKKKTLLIPIFNLDQKEHSTSKKLPNKPLVVYSGGSQVWQNLDLTLNSMSKRKEDFDFVILTKDIDAIKSLLDQTNTIPDLKIKSIKKENLPKEYEKAHFGFILRKFDKVNSVACPTKLIDYMAHGILPIVLEKDIGDFLAFNYQYIKLDEFLSPFCLSEKDYQSKIKRNYLILESFNRIIQRNKEKLVKFLEYDSNTSLKDFDLYLSLDYNFWRIHKEQSNKFHDLKVINESLTLVNLDYRSRFSSPKKLFFYLVKYTFKVLFQKIK